MKASTLLIAAAGIPAVAAAGIPAVGSSRQPYVRATGRRLQTWPHSLTLTIAFDDRPEEVSWTFGNHRSGTILAGRAYGAYSQAQAGTKIVVPLDILTDEDLDGDPLGGTREYRFVMFDRGGNGLCCGRGRGRFEVWDGGRVILAGDEFGASFDAVFEVDPEDYLDPEQQQTGEPPQGGAQSESQSGQDGGGGGRPRPVTTDRPTASPTGRPAPSRPAPSFSIAIAGPGFNPGPSAAQSGHTAAKPMPLHHINHDSWYCGPSWEWTASNCESAVPCPGGDAVYCPPNHACFASTPCKKLEPTLDPTSQPSSSPSSFPSVSSVPTIAPYRSGNPKDIEPLQKRSKDFYVEFLYGDGDDANAADDNGSSTSDSSGVASGSRDFFVDFLYGDADAADDGGTSAANPSGLPSDVIDALSSYEEFQFHFFCGISWTDANSKCGTFCPSGDKSVCPDGMGCYANTRCDGRDTASPTSSPGPTAANPDACTICGEKMLDGDRGITFGDQETTCGNINEQLAAQDIDKSSGICDTIGEMYSDQCCYDECSLCESPDGTTLDLRPDRVVRQGGYEATCLEITEALSSSGDDSLCADARDQLGGQCCLAQCELCSGLPGETAPQWYETVMYNGQTTTCLGLDFLLRAEEVGEGEEVCNQFRNEYGGSCCYPPSSSVGDVPTSGRDVTSSWERTAPECRLCEADGRIYDVMSEKSINMPTPSIWRHLAGTCGGLDEELKSMSKEDQMCTENRQRYFGSCCSLADYIPVAWEGGSAPSPAAAGGSPIGTDATTDVVSNSATSPDKMTSHASSKYWDGTPSDDFDWQDTWATPWPSGSAARTAALGNWMAQCLCWTVVCVVWRALPWR